MNEESTAALALLSRMRFACGDNGARMQDELEEYLRELKRDAERYRWLRDDVPWLLTSGSDGTRITAYMMGINIASIGPYSDEFDEAIDAAMKGANKNSSTPLSHNTEG